MQRDNNIQYTISMQDEATAVLKNFNREATSSMAGVQSSVRSLNMDTQSMTGYIREGRTARREEAFALRESQAAMMGLSMAMGEGTDVMSGLTKATNDGFMAFSGIKFATSALLGPWGLLLAGVAAAVTIYEELTPKTNSQTDALKREKDNLDLLIKEYDGWRSKLHGSTQANMEASKAEAAARLKDYDDLNATIKIQVYTLEKLQLAYEKEYGYVEAKAAAVLGHWKDRTKAIEENQAKLQELFVIWQAAEGAIIGPIAAVNKELDYEKGS